MTHRAVVEVAEPDHVVELVHDVQILPPEPVCPRTDEMSGRVIQGVQRDVIHRMSMTWRHEAV